MDGKPRKTGLYVKRQIPHPLSFRTEERNLLLQSSIPAASHSRFLNGYRRFGMTKLYRLGIAPRRGQF